jgi:lysophospholipase L1-like esterase
LDIECVHGVDEKIKKADQDKKLMRASDGSHLNEDGERIVGEWLAQWYLKKYTNQ